MFNPNFDGTDPNQQWNQQGAPVQPQLVPATVQPDVSIPQYQDDDSDQARRPPNAFILYSQTMRTQVRSENPTLSNTEVSSLLGKMWKDVPNDVKLQYKQKAQALQEEFKKAHPGYTYRKARKKRALNELLTKTQGLGAYPFPGGDPYGLQQGYPGIPGYPFQMVPGMPMQQQMQPPMQQPIQQIPPTMQQVSPSPPQGAPVYNNMGYKQEQ